MFRGHKFYGIRFVSILLSEFFTGPHRPIHYAMNEKQKAKIKELVNEFAHAGEQRKTDICNQVVLLTERLISKQHMAMLEKKWAPASDEVVIADCFDAITSMGQRR